MLAEPGGGGVSVETDIFLVRRPFLRRTSPLIFKCW
jgi:hypothetical protein